MLGLTPAYGMQGQASTSSLIMCRLHRHTGLVPVSSLLACRPRLTTCRGRPWRLIIALDSGIRRNDGQRAFAGMTASGHSPEWRRGCIRRYDGVYFRRHTGLVPVSSLLACRPRLTTCRGRPWRLIIALDSGIRRYDGQRAFAGMTASGHSPEWRRGCIRRYDGVYFRRHTGLVPVSSLISCRPGRRFVSLDSGIRRNGGGAGAGMTP